MKEMPATTTTGRVRYYSGQWKICFKNKQNNIIIIIQKWNKKKQTNKR